MAVMTVWRSRFQGTYYTYTPVKTKGPRAKETYRGARRNVGRNSYNTWLRERRKALGMTRREYECKAPGMTRREYDAFRRI